VAGIGFRLNRYFSTQQLTSRVKGVFYSVIVSNGPWLISILVIAFLSIVGKQVLKLDELLIFKSIISYSFAFSLILFGAIEMPVTRYLADKMYIDDMSSLKSLYVTLLSLSALIAGLFGYPFYYFVEATAQVKVMAVMLFFVILWTWVSMVFLSAAKSYGKIVFAFGFGALVSIGLGWIFGKQLGLVGYLFSFLVGQLLQSSILAAIVFVEFPGRDYISFEWLNYFRKYKILVGIGVLYFLGIWIDKILYWLSPEYSITVSGPLKMTAYYDTAMFLSYITVVPTTTFFLVKIETNFYQHYKYYFQAIDEKVSFPILKEILKDLVVSLRFDASRLLKLQFIVMLLCWFFTEEIFVFLRMPGMQSIVFKFGVIGSMLQAFLLCVNLLLMYFEDYKSVFYTCLTFCLGNFFFTLITMNIGDKTHGLGFALGSFSGLVLALFRANRRFEDIPYHTFMGQRLSNSEGS
jgi:uncharacterized membrane protein